MKAGLKTCGKAISGDPGDLFTMHTMTLINEHEGTGEWLCPSCGRHLLVSWDPVFTKTVLAEGDPTANHIRIKKKMQTGDKRDVPAGLLPKPAVEHEEDPRLIPWLNWMDESGFEDLWKGNAR